MFEKLRGPETLTLSVPLPVLVAPKKFEFPVTVTVEARLFEEKEMDALVSELKKDKAIAERLIVRVIGETGELTPDDLQRLLALRYAPSAIVRAYQDAIYADPWAKNDEMPLSA